MATIVYVLRIFPELTETFIRREIEALERSESTVMIMAMEQARTPLRDPEADGRKVIDLSQRATSEPSRTGARRRRLWPFCTAVVKDCIALKLHPRRSARCLRLAFFALRGSKQLPMELERFHAHFANDAAALARYLSILSDTPYSVTAHAYDLYQDPYLLRSNLESAHHVFTVSRANLDVLLSMASEEGWPRDRFSVLRCGIDLSQFHYRDPPPPSTPLRLLCVARLVPKKGHGILLEAVRQLVAEDVPVMLRIVGDGPLRAQLRDQASDLRSNVEFLGGVPPQEIPTLMQESDLVVLASRVAEDGDRDGLPVSLIEACALGVPVLSTAVSGIPELITQETGLLVPPDSPGLLAGAVHAFLKEPHARRVERCRLARRAVEESFDVHQQAATLRSL